MESARSSASDVRRSGIEVQNSLERYHPTIVLTSGHSFFSPSNSVPVFLCKHRSVKVDRFLAASVINYLLKHSCGWVVGIISGLRKL